ncbi:MAG: hypothetical protein K8F91_18550 [Candidatus Obscuribacterales bacterium]|nr:hypothetical protein [Candidatus Obscuribacterales bacterium]
MTTAFNDKDGHSYDGVKTAEDAYLVSIGRPDLVPGAYPVKRENDGTLTPDYERLYEQQFRRVPLDDGRS